MTYFEDNAINIVLPFAVVTLMSVETTGKED